MIAPDRALWVTWYDLPDGGRDDHLAWLHGTHIPGLLQRPGYLWAASYAAVPDETTTLVRHVDDPAIPTGSEYILIVGGEDCNVFGNPAPSDLSATSAPKDLKMLAMRVGERANIFAEAARVTGPGAEDQDGMVLGPCIQFGTYTGDCEAQMDILAWYAQLQMPTMAGLPGSIRTRRLASVYGWAGMGILYEFGSVELRAEHFRRSGPNKWSRSIGKLVHAPGSPNVARRLWPVVV